MTLSSFISSPRSACQMAIMLFLFFFPAMGRAQECKAPPVNGIKARQAYPEDAPDRTLYLCEGSTVNLADSVNGPAPGYTLQWYRRETSGRLVIDKGIINKAVYTGVNSIYYVKNYTPASCSASLLAVHISILPLPSMKNAPSAYQVCENMPVRFTAQDAHTGNSPTYDWYLNGALANKNGGPVYTLSPNPFKAGQQVNVFYVVHISPDAPYYSCSSAGLPGARVFSSDTVSVQILSKSILPGPIIGPDIVYEGQQNAFYQTRLDNTLTYSWSFSNPAHASLFFVNNTVSINYSKSLTFPASQEIIDSLIVTVNTVCDFKRESLAIHIRPILHPINILTPNGDGINDEWIIYNIDNAGYKGNTVKVYDRNSTLVYSKTNYSNTSGWNGTWNGKPLATGTYYYVILFNEGTAAKSITGYVTILRK